jgi:hypothetical protein
MRETLIQTLSAVGKPTELYQSPDGSQILLLPYGGRVLGLFAPGNDENFYWTHPALESAASAREFYASDLWHNSGGDRTWLSPEADIFFPKFPDLSNYFQPRQLDPGQYQVDRQGGAVRLVNRLSVTMSRSQVTVDLEIAKSVGPAPNPLRYERGLAGLEDVEYAGYTQHTSLEILGQATAQVGLWNLVQMPHGGDLLIPTYVRAKPKIYFNSVGTIPPEDLLVTDHLVRYKMRQTGEHKLGIRAVSSAGRVGYLYQNNDRWDLIIRNFSVNPSGEYIDVPWSDTEDLGYSTQACNVNSGLGQFSELEYHIPAIGPGTGRTRCDDVAQVWAFRGLQQPILAVAQALLAPLCG